MPNPEPLSERNLDQTVSFLRSSNPFAQHTWGWDSGRFLDWRWGANTTQELANPGWFASNCTLFRDGAGIRAVAVAEYGGPDVAIITGGEEPHVVGQVLAWLRANRPGPLSFVVSSRAAWLRSLLVEAELDEKPNVGCEWEYDLGEIRDSITLPEGFTLGSLEGAPASTRAGINICIQRAFGSDYDHEPGLRSIESSPGFRPELSVVAWSPDGLVAAYCRGTVDPETGVCGIDPVCTHPDFQGIGLGKAVVLTAFAKQSELGGRQCYIGSAPEPAPGTYLYRTLGPSDMTIMSAWTVRELG